jgi:hypothetical protein
MPFFPHPLPWCIAGPMIGLVVPALLLLGNKSFGVSSNFRHLCAAIAPCGLEFFGHDWRKTGLWNLVFLAGVLAGAMLAARLAPPPVLIAPHTVATLRGLGLDAAGGLAPHEIFTWASLLTLRGFVCIVVGGFLVGFGTAYAGGCTSGHAIAGLADLQLSSLIAVAGFFAGGLTTTFVVLPWLLG